MVACGLSIALVCIFGVVLSGMFSVNGKTKLNLENVKSNRAQEWLRL